MKVGDYVRTNYGITQIKEDVCLLDEIIKSSPNIIDLIEVGDYVNGCYVEDIGKTFVNVARGSNYFNTPTIFENDIKSIVTKEQFESMEYRIGE